MIFKLISSKLIFIMTSFTYYNIQYESKYEVYNNMMIQDSILLINDIKKSKN